MRDHGYTTGAVVANPLVLAKNMHFDQGFSYFAAPAAPQRAGQVVDAALAFLDARKGLPTFLYVHTMDAHTPYQPPPPFDRKFGPRPQPGRAAAEPSDYRVPATSTGSWASTTGRWPTATASSGAFSRACGSAASTIGRRSSSSPTTGRSSSTTAAGSTATPSSTSWCACPSS